MKKLKVLFYIAIFAGAFGGTFLAVHEPASTAVEVVK